MLKFDQASVIFLPATRSPERDSDCWPDWAREDAETRAFAERNTPTAVLGDVVWFLVGSAAVFGVLCTVIKLISQ